MTYSKRQFFIHRIEQVLNLLATCWGYTDFIHEYCKNSKYNKKGYKLKKQLGKCMTLFNEFLELVDGKRVKE